MKVDIESDGSCRLLIVPHFRGSSRFESLHHSRFTYECNKEEIDDDDDDADGAETGLGAMLRLCLGPPQGPRHNPTVGS